MRLISRSHTDFMTVVCMQQGGLALLALEHYMPVLDGRCTEQYVLPATTAAAGCGGR